MTITHRAIRRAAGVLLAAGLIALGYAALVAIGARVYQTSEQRRSDRSCPSYNRFDAS
jgi:hypothetical protein